MIEINNLTRRPLDKHFLERIAQTVLREEGKGRYYLSLALVGKDRIERINRRYLKRNRATDVLAFPGDRAVIRRGCGGAVCDMGEIIICPVRVRRNAKLLGIAYREELARVAIHGILHLLGYDHEKKAQAAQKMFARQNYYLSKVKS